MALTWDEAINRKYQLGIEHGVLYLRNAEGTGYQTGIPWNGLISVQLSPSGGDPNKLRADNMVYAVLRSPEESAGTITAYMAPPEFDACDGKMSVTATEGTAIVSGQERKPFALGFRTKTGDAGTGVSGYKVVYLYGCTVSPSDKTYETVGENPEAQQLSWSYTCDGERITGIPNAVTMMEITGTAVDVSETLPMPSA